MQAEKAADAVLSWETAAEYEGGGTSCASTEEASNSPKGTAAACIIVEVRLRRLLCMCCKSRNAVRIWVQTCHASLAACTPHPTYVHTRTALLLSLFHERLGSDCRVCGACRH